MGFLFFGGTVGWVGHVSVTGAVLLVASLALFFAAWGSFAAWIMREAAGRGAARSAPGTGHRFLLALPAAWVLLEFLRNTLLSGFGWNLLAHTQWSWIHLIQIADLTGAPGISFLVVMVNTALWLTVSRTGDPWRRPWREAAPDSTLVRWTAALCVLGALFYGHHRLKQVDQAAADPSAPALKIAVVQGNIPQREKWDEGFQEMIWSRHEALTRRAAEERPDLIVWPETAAPGFLEETAVQGRLASLAKEMNTALLVGIPSEPEPGRLLNSAVWIGADGRIGQRYDKIHLVPFGEFIPLRPLLGWLTRLYPIPDFSPGREFTVFQTSPALSVLVCFEDLFPGLSRAFVSRGARVLFVITNDGWFGRSAASLQHLQASVFRAVEGRVWIGRAANTGWSGFVDPAGRRLPSPGQVPRFEEGVAVARVTEGPPVRTYVRCGEWFLWLCLLLAGLALRPGSGS